jgi:hypothetical protein
MKSAMALVGLLRTGNCRAGAPGRSGSLRAWGDVSRWASKTCSRRGEGEQAGARLEARNHYLEDELIPMEQLLTIQAKVRAPGFYPGKLAEEGKAATAAFRGGFSVRGGKTSASSSRSRDPGLSLRVVKTRFSPCQTSNPIL